VEVDRQRAQWQGNRLDDGLIAGRQTLGGSAR
jgi:hypothetical protein